MEKKAPSLNIVAVFNILSPLVLNGLAFFTMPIFTRILGTEAYGLYTNYSSYCNILAVLVGFQAAGAIAPASVYYSGEDRDKCFSNIITMALFSAAAIGIVLLIFARPISAFTGISIPMLAVLFFHSLGIFAVNFAAAKYNYDKKSFLSFIISTGLSVASIGLSLLLILKIDPTHLYEGYTFGHAAPYALVGIFLAYKMLRRGRSYFKKEYWSFTLALCLPLIFHQLSNSLLHQCDKIMIKQITADDAAVGIYGFAVTFANILNIVWGALNTTFVPFYHDDVKAGDLASLNRKVKNYTFLFSCMAIGFIYASPEVAKLFGDSAFWDATKIIPLLAYGLYFVFLYSFPVNFEFYHRRTKTIALGTCLAAAVNVGLNIVFINLWGMIGAAVATAVSYIFLWIFHSILARLTIKEPYPFEDKPLLLGFGAVSAALGIFYLIADMWYIRWVVFALLAAAILLKIKKQKTIF